MCATGPTLLHLLSSWKLSRWGLGAHVALPALQLLYCWTQCAALHGRTQVCEQPGLGFCSCRDGDRLQGVILRAQNQGNNPKTTHRFLPLVSVILPQPQHYRPLLGAAWTTAHKPKPSPQAGQNQQINFWIFLYMLHQLWLAMKAR